MKKTVFTVCVAAVVGLATPAPASAVCPAAPAGDPGRSEFATQHIVELAHAGALGHEHKPGMHRGASDCEELND